MENGATDDPRGEIWRARLRHQHLLARPFKIRVKVYDLKYQVVLRRVAKEEYQSIIKVLVHLYSTSVYITTITYSYYVLE